MSESVTVRAATTDDAGEIAAVATAAWERDYPTVLNRERPGEAARDWYDAARLRRDIEDPAYVVRVAERDGPVGFVHAFGPEGSERRDGDILRVYVHPEARGAGVGRALVAAAREELEARGCDRVRAMVLAANDAGCAFYEACGFERTDETGETTIDGERYEEVVLVDDRRS